MLTTITTSGVRFSFRALRQHLASQLKLGKRVVLYGAGDAGLLALREMRQNRALGRTAVGFLDDDKRKIGRTVQGLEVLGSIENLEEIVSKHGVEEVVLTSIRMPEARIDKIIEFCHARHIPCSTFTLSFRPIEPGESVSSSQ